MNNDLRFLSSAGAVIFCFIVVLGLLGKVYEVGYSYDGHNVVPLFIWFGLLLVAAAATVPVVIVYHKQHARRWEQSRRDAETLAVETLAELGRQRRKQKK